MPEQGAAQLLPQPKVRRHLLPMMRQHPMLRGAVLSVSVRLVLLGVQQQRAALPHPQAALRPTSFLPEREILWGQSHGSLPVSKEG